MDVDSSTPEPLSMPLDARSTVSDRTLDDAYRYLGRLQNASHWLVVGGGTGLVVALAGATTFVAARYGIGFVPEAVTEWLEKGIFAAGEFTSLSAGLAVLSQQGRSFIERRRRDPTTPPSLDEVAERLQHSTALQEEITPLPPLRRRPSI